MGLPWLLFPIISKNKKLNRCVSGKHRTLKKKLIIKICFYYVIISMLDISSYRIKI